MPNANASQHVYQRTVSGDAQDSLSIIAGLIEPGQSLLDLGMGTGGLGQHLSQRFAIVADGVTLNEAEANIARQWYRKTKVADLDSANLIELCDGRQYDCIVCADVLEHLKNPQTLLAQCKARLKSGGRLITSVPNAGYCGLIAELIQGEFRYRPEGLLDNTHLRFFTRKSLARFFDEQGWLAVSVQATRRNLPDSEFHVTFDSLPPAVARHLLALPDALTYQFVTVLTPGEQDFEQKGLVAHTEYVSNAMQFEASAMFSAQLYVSTAVGYLESSKQVTAGCIGLARQILQFDIAQSTEPYRAVRLDPADRPGFFRLFNLTLTLPDGAVVWQWDAAQGHVSLSETGHHQQIVFQPPWALSDGVLLFLWGDDPWLELLLPQLVLQQLAQHGASLEVVCGWPMSADYIQASLAMQEVQTKHAADLEVHGASEAKLQAEYQRLSLERQQLNIANQLLEHRLDNTQDTLLRTEGALRSVQIDKQALLSELRAAKYQSQTRINQLVTHLQTIEQSTVFRMTRPLVNAKMQLDQWLGKSSQGSHNTMTAPPPLPLPAQPVDIIVPVYRGLQDTRCCIESVLNSNCQASWRLIVINDCSPEPAVAEWLRNAAATDSRVLLLENVQNLGFVGTVNRGMALSDSNDVLLLNSDTEVANDWLDRIQRAAYSVPQVASVTPFSNNATICSYPRFCQPNDMPLGFDTTALDALFAKQLAGKTVSVPTGVGFCMYVRRQCLQEIGLFDEANFGKGYGEENDFCVRAQAAGWQHLHALDTFVRHAGGISFGYSKNERELQAMETLRRLHPRYEADVMGFVDRDPAGPARLAMDIARITSGKPVILSVIHNREGGTLRHIQELAQQLGQLATFLRLSPAPGGVVLRLEGQSEALALHFAVPKDHARLVETLKNLGVGHVHFHHLLGHAPEIVQLPQQLGLSHDFTAHDYFSYCPQISLTDHTDRYCGEEGLKQCHQCLQRHPAPGSVSIEIWRERHAKMLRSARYVIAPSQDTAQRLRYFVPGANVVVVPHAALDASPPPESSPKPRLLKAGTRLKVVVLGALSRIKGADVLEEVATLAAQRDLAVDFHLIGYAYRSLRTQPKARLTVHGAYDDPDLPQLLNWLQPDVIWFPAVWPETYSYTLSTSLESGLPIIAPTIGAFAERLQGRSWTWLRDWQQTGVQWVEFFEDILAHHFLTGIGPQTPSQHLGDPTLGRVAFAYRGEYLQSLPRPTAPGALEIETINNLLPHLQGVVTKSSAGHILKSSTLRTIVRLRASAALSPLARLVPTHLQRRVKSWLGK